MADVSPRDFNLVEMDIETDLDSSADFDTELGDSGIRDETDIDGPRGTDAESDQAFESDQAMGDMAQLDVDQTLGDMAQPQGNQALDASAADVVPLDMNVPQGTSVSNAVPPLETIVRGNPNGGQRFDDVCPDGQALIGIAGEIRNGAQYIGRLRGLCGVVSIEPGNPVSIDTMAGADLPLRGAFGGGGNFGVTCQAGSAVVGFSGRAGRLIDQLIVHCGALSLNGDSVRAIGNLPLPPVGGNGGNAVPLVSCPNGQTAAGVVIRAGDGIDGFGLLCSPLLLAP
ncbi:MAG: hypothetical protein VYA30_02600 [Myxococcota bacterium]|nr:hypothetical protein [Myxococcota bacterium]